MRAAVAALVALLAVGHVPSARAECQGAFPDFIGDICWSCIFPLTIAGVELAGGDQLDIDDGLDGLCICGSINDWSYGLPVGFWEPARIVEVTRTPYCLVTLGGLQVAPGLSAREPGARTRGGGTVPYSFHHVHWYSNPLLHWLGVLLDFDCLERAGFDLAYVSELDPTWDDDALSTIIYPESVLAANLPAVAACAADCLATTTGWGDEFLWWCAGCTGLLVPPNGNVHAHVSGRQSSALLAARVTARMHRVGGAFYTHGGNSACGPGRYSVLFEKDAYKMSMVLPKAQAKVGGRCCQPFGSSPELWATGGEWPVTGEDFSYLLFRKRECCVGLIGK